MSFILLLNKFIHEDVFVFCQNIFENYQRHFFLLRAFSFLVTPAEKKEREESNHPVQCSSAYNMLNLKLIFYSVHLYLQYRPQISYVYYADLKLYLLQYVPFFSRFSWWNSATPNCCWTQQLPSWSTSRAIPTLKFKCKKSSIGTTQPWSSSVKNMK